MAKLTGTPSVFVGDTSSVFDSAEFTVGQRGYDANGNEYIFLQGVANTTAGSWVIYDEVGVTTLLNDTNNKGFVAIAMAAIGANQYGWYLVRGSVSAKVAEAVADNAPLYTSATDGSAGGTTTGHTAIARAITRGSTAGAGLVTVQVDYPSVTI